jgi:hypothetical protein
MAWEEWKNWIEAKIEKRVKIATEKIERLKELIERLKEMNKEPQFVDETWDESGYEQYYQDLAREIDEVFCIYYNSVPTGDGGYLLNADCYICPLDTCNYISVVKKIYQCFNETDIDAECRSCPLIRYCNHL